MDSEALRGRAEEMCSLSGRRADMVGAWGSL